MQKTCTACGRSLPESSFAVAKYRRDGTPTRRNKCHACRNQGRADSRRTEYRAPPAPKEITAEGTLAEHRERRDSSELKRKVHVLAAQNDELNRLLETMRAVPPAKTTVIAAGKPEKGEAVALWMGSDWHVEERVDGNKVQGINNFDLAEAERRAAKFFVNGLRLTHMAARETKVKSILIDLGGDFFSNSIHEELLETNQLGPTKAVAFARDLLTSGIKHILANSDLDVELACVVGNHGRITKKIRFSTAVENNLEYLMYQWLAASFANEPRVKFHICPGTMQFVKLFDSYLIRIVHGYEIQSGGGVGGITIPIRKKLAGWDRAQQADLTLIHHFHQRLDGGDFLVNGSLIGYNEFAQANGFSPEPPQQQFALIHSRNDGEKTIVAPIWVT